MKKDTLGKWLIDHKTTIIMNTSNMRVFNACLKLNVLGAVINSKGWNKEKNYCAFRFEEFRENVENLPKEEKENLRLLERDGTFSEFAVQQLFEVVKYYLKAFDYLHLSSSSLKLHSLYSVAGNDGDLNYSLICPYCETIVIVNHGDPCCNNPLFCPTCNKKHIKPDFVYPWPFYTKEDKDYQGQRNLINFSMDWEKKYYFSIGKPGSRFHIGKWYPYLKVKNEAYSGGYKFFYLHLGFYPYRVYLDIKRFPYKLAYLFDKYFRPKVHEEKVKRWMSPGKVA